MRRPDGKWNDVPTDTTRRFFCSQTCPVSVTLSPTVFPELPTTSTSESSETFKWPMLLGLLAALSVFLILLVGIIQCEKRSITNLEHRIRDIDKYLSTFTNNVPETRNALESL